MTCDITVVLYFQFHICVCHPYEPPMCQIIKYDYNVAELIFSRPSEYGMYSSLRIGIWAEEKIIYELLYV